MKSLTDMQTALDNINRLIAMGDQPARRLLLTKEIRAANPDSLEDMRDALEQEIVAWSVREGQFAIFQQEQRASQIARWESASYEANH